MVSKRIIALIGSVLMFIGIFTPIAKLPVYGTITYYQNNNFTASIIAALALLSLILTSLKQFRYLIVTGFASLAVLCLSLSEYFSNLAKFKREIGLEFGESIMNIAASAVQIQWGWIVLFLGSLMIICGGFSRKDTN